MIHPFTSEGSFPKSFRLLLILSLIGLLTDSCQEDELKKPTKVGVDFKVDDHPPSYSGNGGLQGPPISLSLSEGRINVRSIRIIGDRKKGEDVDFERQERFSVPIGDLSTGTKTLFELPQGTYNDLRIRLTLAHPDKEAVFCKGERVQHFPNTPSEATPFRLHIKDQVVVECEVDPKNGGDELQLRKNEGRTIRVFFRPGKWFLGLGMGRWNQADVVTEGGVEVIPIDKGTNPWIHKRVLGRLANAFNASIL